MNSRRGVESSSTIRHCGGVGVLSPASAVVFSQPATNGEAWCSLQGWGGVGCTPCSFKCPCFIIKCGTKSLLLGIMAHLLLQLPWALRQEDPELRDSLGYVARLLTKLSPLCFREYDGKSDLHVGLTNTHGEHFLHFSSLRKPHNTIKGKGEFPDSMMSQQQQTILPSLQLLLQPKQVL